MRASEWTPSMRRKHGQKIAAMWAKRRKMGLTRKGQKSLATSTKTKLTTQNGHVTNGNGYQTPTVIASGNVYATGEHFLLVNDGGTVKTFTEKTAS